ncbi:3-dehydroquinate synthase [Paraperlucidibaca baekdonensis]|uniref:3-dehydroquinate synthase n=1 Tax=Paraperlucidibaca baekdonensis TaxID=748120 RepID=A0A3E0H9P9_9GAMM|nr:3-dehydroquinate synthase [Paraperlucidibaca baekdonensis]REH40436.1 3-dehydroquinate synthase [Paraperlucidibaca baekdonensis]
MPVLTVALGQRSYPIHIDEQVFANADLLLPHIHGRQVMLVSNTTVAPLYLAPLRGVLEAAGLTVAEVILPDGEQFKDWQHLQHIFDALLQARFGRKATLIALGGGVIGDMTGFAAATYQRGVHFIQIPTTLLAQVDSSVGGKTGINHTLGKNMIGAFMQPQVVLADTAVLRTLPDRELSAGLAEIIKYGLIRDPGFLHWLHDHMPGLMARDPALLAEAVARSCHHKAEVVAADELEQHDVRALLNLGHTFGHAIETNMGYGQWLHGEAVAVGMLMAADLSQRFGWIDAAAVAALRTLLLAAGLPVDAPAISAADFLAAMAVDKKNVDGRLRLVLLRAVGDAVVVNVDDLAPVRDTLAAFGVSA